MSLCIFLEVFQVVFDLIRGMLNGKTLIRFTGNCRMTELQDGKNSFFPDFTWLF